MKKVSLLFFILYLGSANLFSQDTKIITINSDLFRTSYEKISEDAFGKLWDESVSQQLKITLFDQTVKAQLILGGGIVSYDELKLIPELKEMMINGTFPADRLFVKHVCQVEFGVNGNIKTLLEAGVSFPYRVSYIESISQDESVNPLKIKKQKLQFFKNYIDMMSNRIDKSTLSLENSLLPSDLILKTGEQFSVERFLLGTIGLGSELFEFKVDNPILLVRGKASFQPIKFSKTFQHTRTTVQNYGSVEEYRVTISKKKINTLEFFNTDFGFELKTKKKLFKLMRLNLGINLFRFSPTWNFYSYRHRQFTGDFDSQKVLSNLKRSYFLGEDNFLKHKNDQFQFFRTYQVKGHSFSNEVNLLNLYRNSHQEKIENRFIDSSLNTRENIGVGTFSRIKTNFFNTQKLSLNVASDYSFQYNKNQNKENRSGLILNFYDNDVHGINETRHWYLAYTRKLLEEYYPKSTSEFDFLLLNADGDQFKRNLIINFDSQAFQSLLHDRKNLDKKCFDLFIKIFQPNKSDSAMSKWRKEYVLAMVKRTLDRIYTMNELLDLQFISSVRTKISVNRLKTPGQLPMRDVIYLLIATAIAKDNIAFEFSINRIPERNSLMESPLSKNNYQFKYIGKNFKDSFDQLEFYY